MTPPPLTHQQRLDLAEKIKRLEQEVQDEWGTSWNQLRDEVEQSMDTILTNPQ